MTRKRRIRDAVEILDRLVGDDVELRKRIEEETLNCKVARLIYDARKEAGLTQAQLAELVGTQQSVIARLEDADYSGHSLYMLARIATAMSQRVEVRFVRQPEQSAEQFNHASA